MAGNKNLIDASKAKKDEFYTQLSDIESELKHYRHHFEGKTVLCNCDDPYESNFSKFFFMHFNDWGLRKLICTCYSGSPITSTQLDLFEERLPKGEKSKVAYKLVLTEVRDWNQDGAVDIDDVRLFLEKHKPERLQGTGDFASEECVELLKEADIVVTNPPFSLFRKYLALLVEYGKQFLIIGNQNAITYKEVFPLIKENKMWLGFGFKGGAAHFISHYKDVATAGDHRVGMIRVSGVVWFTNLDHNKRHEPLDLFKHYTPEEYPKYDNYDAIEVSKTSDIPCDYDGFMGVPITFLDKYCPEQFVLEGASESEGKGFSNGLWDARSGVAQPLMGGGNCTNDFLSSIRIPGYPKYDRPYLNGRRLYFRLFIRKIHDRL